MYGGSRWNVDRIVLDNGRILTFTVAEGDGCYAIEAVNHAPIKEESNEQAK